MSDSLIAQTIQIDGSGGDSIQAYQARPLDSTDRGGVVVIHHLPGYDRATKEITRRLAEIGYDAICPNLYWRECPDVSPDEAAATVRAAGGVPDQRLTGDVAGAAAHLRSLPENNGKVGVIGFCSGGRQSVLAAATVDLDAAVDCYGGFVVEPVPAERGLSATPLLDLLPDLRCPLLGLFGAEDTHPSPEHVAELDRRLTDAGKPHEFHSYPGAGHGFFSIDRPNYRVEAAEDGWTQITDFYGRYLS